MNRFTISLLLLLHLAGCSLGDRSAVRIVSLRPAAQPQKTGMTIPEAEIQEALKIIDKVLVSAGLREIPTPPSGHSDNALRHYEGSSTRGCSVSIHDQHLIVLFLEFKERQSSKPVKRLCSSLEQELGQRFGSQQVRIETRH
jgi:hypothetical protein